MSRTFNFNNIQKQYFVTTLPDEKKTVLMIGTPTKEVIGDLLSLNTILSSDNMSKDTIDTVYEICAKLMSYNKGGIKITKQMLAEIIDLEALILFIGEYAKFIKEVTNVKN